MREARPLASPWLWLQRVRLRMLYLVRRMTMCHLVLGCLLLTALVLTVEQLIIIHVPADRYLISAPLFGLQTNPRVGVSKGLKLFSVREFSRVCCDLGPTVYRGASLYDKNVLGRGGQERAQYSFAYALQEWEQSRSAAPKSLRTNHIIEDGRNSVGPGPTATRIFVPTAMVHEFIKEFFLGLPSEGRVVVVTGQEDCGPAELFGYGRKKCRQPMPLSLEEFVEDPRLVGWFAQNYDLVGCAHVEATRIENCHDPKLSHSAMNKIRPLPIGLDFHTIAEKRRFGRLSPAEQEMTLRQASRVPWVEKPLGAIAAFKIEFQKPDRAVLGKHLESAKLDRCVVQPTSKLGRIEFWELHDTAAFVLSPQGNGIDTHRVYESLNLGSVPIVHTSPLDQLYRLFPIIIIQDWSDFISCEQLQGWKDEILQRFGAAPFENAQVQEKLELLYWTNQVLKKASSIV